MNMTQDRMNLVKLFVSLMVFIFSDRRSYEYECFLVHYLLSWRSIPEQIRDQKNVNSQNKKKHTKIIIKTTIVWSYRQYRLVNMKIRTCRSKLSEKNQNVVTNISLNRWYAFEFFWLDPYGSLTRLYALHILFSLRKKNCTKFQ